MTDKAYIVANEQQEMAVLEKLENLGAEWNNGSVPTEYTLATRKSLKILDQSVYGKFLEFPYVIYSNDDKYLAWDRLVDLDFSKVIVFDGRKEEQMSDKYVVSQEFMDGLEEWKNNRIVAGHGAVYYYVGSTDISHLPVIVEDWWKGSGIEVSETNNRLIAIIRWVNGEDVFNVEKPKKWIVRSKGTDDDDNYSYVFINLHNFTLSTYHISNATKFDTKEEAESWANSHQEVVEVEE